MSKIFLVISFVSMFSDVGQTFITDRTFDSFEECSVHEVYIDHTDFHFGLMCVDEFELENMLEWNETNLYPEEDLVLPN